MARTLQLRRGTTANLSSVTGAIGELFVDTDKDTVVVMDGSTSGGFPLAKFSDVTTANLAMKGYVDSVSGGSYGNTQVSAYLPTHSGNIGGQFVGNIRTDNYFYANGTAVTFGGGGGGATNSISSGLSNVAIIAADGNIFANVNTSISANIGSSVAWFRNNVRAVGSVLFGSAGDSIIEERTDSLGFSTTSNLGIYIRNRNGGTQQAMVLGDTSTVGTATLFGINIIDGIGGGADNRLNLAGNGRLSTNSISVTGNIWAENIIGNLAGGGTTSNIFVSTNLHPSANVTYDLGTNTQRWRDIWLANSTIYLGNTRISTSTAGNVIANVNGTIAANIGSGESWFGSNVRVRGVLTNNYYYANGAAVSFGGGGGGATISQVSDFTTYYLVGTSSTSGSLSTASINTNIRFVPFSPVLYIGTYTAITGSYIQTQYLANSTSSSGTAGQVLTSGGSGTDFYWSTPAAGGGGGTLAIGNAVYLMWYAGSAYYLARGWVYKSSKMTYPGSSTMYFRFYDYYSSPSINPSWSTVKDAPSPSTWSFQGSSPSASSFASSVSFMDFIGLEFYSDYTFAGSEMIMPMTPTSTSATPAATLKYPSGGLNLSGQSVSSDYDSMTNPTWGYAPNYYIYFNYYLDGTQDSKIASFNYP